MLFISAVMLYLTPLAMLVIFAGRWGSGRRLWASSAGILTWLGVSFWLAYGDLHD